MGVALGMIGILLMLLVALALVIRYAIKLRINKEMDTVTKLTTQNELRTHMGEVVQLMRLATILGLHSDVNAFIETCDIKGFTLSRED